MVHGSTKNITCSTYFNHMSYIKKTVHAHHLREWELARRAVIYGVVILLTFLDSLHGWELNIYNSLDQRDSIVCCLTKHKYGI